MKKIALSLICSALFISTNVLYAEETPAPKEQESVFPDLVCVDSVTFSLMPKNIDAAVEADASDSIFMTSDKAESVDKKSKSVKIWITKFAKWDNQASHIRDYGAKYEKYGYSKYLTLIDTKNKKVKLLTEVDYNCDGSVIETSGNGNWGNIVPGSVMDSLRIQLAQKYKL